MNEQNPNHETYEGLPDDRILDRSATLEAKTIITPEDKEATGVEALGLLEPTVNELKRIGVHTLLDLLSANTEALRGHMIAPAHILRIKNRLKELGWDLPSNDGEIMQRVYDMISEKPSSMPIAALINTEEELNLWEEFNLQTLGEYGELLSSVLENPGRAPKETELLIITSYVYAVLAERNG